MPYHLFLLVLPVYWKVFPNCCGLHGTAWDRNTCLAAKCSLNHSYAEGLQSHPKSSQQNNATRKAGRTSSTNSERSQDCAVQEQAQRHESASDALTATQQQVKQLSSAKQQAETTLQELAALRSAHQAVQSELAVAKGRLAGVDESCQHSLDRVQSLSAALQEAQQAKVHLN